MILSILQKKLKIVKYGDKNDLIAYSEIKLTGE